MNYIKWYKELNDSREILERMSLRATFLARAVAAVCPANGGTCDMARAVWADHKLVVRQIQTEFRIQKVLTNKLL